jgi:hypothetical protein
MYAGYKEPLDARDYASDRTIGTIEGRIDWGDKWVLPRNIARGIVITLVLCALGYAAYRYGEQYRTEHAQIDALYQIGREL